jgi:hypothetical protein
MTTLIQAKARSNECAPAKANEDEKAAKVSPFVDPALVDHAQSLTNGDRACGGTELGYVDTGMIRLADCNDMNVPMNCFIHPPDEESKKWRWTASNYMPRKELAYGAACYSIEADRKEQIINAVNQYVVPLYEVALANLKSTGKNYYWETTDGEAGGTNS